MSVKLIALLGTLVSAGFIYYCVDMKKMEVVQACNPMSKVEKVEPLIEQPTLSKVSEEIESAKLPIAPIEKSDPAFGVMLGSKVNIVGMFSNDEKESPLMQFIETYCSDKECVNDLRFSNDIKNVNWQKDIVALIQMFDEEDIKKGSLYINSNVLHIEGEITSVEQKKRLDELIAKLKKDDLFVENETINMMTKVSDELTQPDIEEEIVEAKKEALLTNTMVNNTTEVTNTVQNQHVATESKSDISEQPLKNKEETNNGIKKGKESSVSQKSYSEVSMISDLTSSNPILFDKQIKKLTEQSKRVLDKLADSLNKITYRKVEIIMYNNSENDEIFNLVVSQKKADIVKNYLFSKGVKNIISKGKGSQKEAEHIDINIIK